MARTVRAVRARHTFYARGQLIIGDQLYRTDDPVVKRHPDLFEDVDDSLGIVEKATRNPGEKRARPED